MTLKRDTKFQEKLTLGSKNDKRNLVNLQKRTEELCVITLKNDAKFELELTFALKNDMRNLANF